MGTLAVAAREQEFAGSLHSQLKQAFGEGYLTSKLLRLEIVPGYLSEAEFQSSQLVLKEFFPPI